MSTLVEQIRRRMFDMEVTQSDLARAVGRPPARVSELLRGLDRRKPMQDRLALLQDICRALEVDLVLVPRDQASRIGTLIAPHHGAHPRSSETPRSMFEELFVDLGDDGADDEQGRP